MDSEQNNSNLPAPSDSSLTPVPQGSEIQSPAGILPPSDSIPLAEKLAIAREEGFHPMADFTDRSAAGQYSDSWCSG
jgi:hypothetical protein